MKRIGIVSIILILTWGLCLNTCSQAVVVKQMNLEEITSTAKYIFSGVCTSVETRYDDEANRDVIFFKFKISKMLRGEPLSEITFKMNKLAVALGGAPKFKTGEEVVLFLYGKSASGVTSPVGLRQGKFLIKYLPTGEKGVVNQNNNFNLFNGIDKAKYLKKFIGSRNAIEIESVINQHSGVIHYDTFITIVENLVY